MRRRGLLQAGAGLLGTLAASGCATRTSLAPRRNAPHVVVIGGGFAGATCARYLRKWSPGTRVTLAEREPRFVSCPLSNLVLGGSRNIGSLTRDYAGLRAEGIDVVNDSVTAIDAAARTVRLARGDTLRYDRLVVAPGVDMAADEVPGLASAMADGSLLHAWKAGLQTVALRHQLEAMPDGGLFVLHIPRAPYRCPPGPYERACQVAWYFRQHKPRSKVLVLDANDDIVSKQDLFRAAWDTLTPGIVEYRGGQQLLEVDAPRKTVRLTFGEVRADVLNVIPPQRAGAVAAMAGLITANERWCGVDFRSFESRVAPGIHVLGDAILAAPQMPKSGHMANGHAKVCAHAIAALLDGREPDPEPVIGNTCYSFVSDRQAVHVASVHRYDAAKRTMLVVDGTFGVSPGLNDREGAYAEAWARNIWADTLG
ncbi:MAG: NAD(P)/FAD-dependent oxidoreductase [Betaproteobacteria bacterium]|nr:NAD(P)/FAD-dependent oxidoreductase [Betaproteobacteria bacterium]